MRFFLNALDGSGDFFGGGAGMIGEAAHLAGDDVECVGVIPETVEHIVENGDGAIERIARAAGLSGGFDVGLNGQVLIGNAFENKAGVGKWGC